MNFEDPLPIPLAARKSPVRETLFGVTLTDAYRWMEDWRSSEATEWLKAQAAYCEDYLNRLSERKALLDRIAELGDASPAIGGIEVAGGRSFYLRRDTGDKTAKLVVRDAPNSNERLLLDPNAMESPTHYSIDWYQPSHDGRLVAYGLSEGGSEDSCLHVLEVETGAVRDLSISRTQWGAVCWQDDNSGFMYFRFPERGEDAAPSERYKNGAMYLHRLGDNPDNDTELFSREHNTALGITQEDFPLIDCSPLSDWMLGVIVHGVQREITLYAAPKASLNEPADIPWRLIARPEDGITDYAVSGDHLYIKTHKDAPRYQVQHIDLKHPDLKNANTLIPPSDYVIQSIRVAGTYLVTLDLHAGLGRLRRVPLQGGIIETVRLPFEGAIMEWSSEPGHSEILLQLTAWTQSPRIYRYDLTTGRVSDTGWRTPSPVDFSGIVSTEVHAPSHDGTLIPLSIIHKKGLTLDGKNPTLLTGYGSYGISMEPAFTPQMLAWYERGGIYAVAHVRGGGEYGKEWHLAGQKFNKQNTVDDFIACAHYLIKHGHTTPTFLAGSGTSAGGITAGVALVQAPELWGAMVLRVADTNALRSEFMESGPANIPEFGSVLEEEGFRALLIMDAYTQIKNNTNYPPVLITTGTNDPRVAPWQGMKLAARLQEANSADTPILLRVDFSAGHGIGSTRQQRDAELADQFCFLLHVLGRQELD